MTSAPGEVDEVGSDISDWEIEEGVPQFEDQFIQQYLQGREALIEQEKSQRSDESFRQSLSPLAKEASLIVSRILDEEHQTVWNADQNDGEGPTFPGMSFPLAKERMETTKSWQIVKTMPKGALLHAHMDATMDVDFVIDTALATEGVSLCADRPLVSLQDRSKASFSFRYRKPGANKASSIWTKEYETNSFVSAVEAAESFPEGGTSAFKAWLKARCTITPEESLEHHHGVDHVWRKFANCFLPLNSLEYYEPVFRLSVQNVLSQFAVDGIQWIDYRCVFVQPFFATGSEKPCVDNTEFLQLWTDEIAKFKATRLGKKFWGCRFIWTSLRYWGKKQIVEHMKSCIEMKKKFPDLICGYDRKSFTFIHQATFQPKSHDAFKSTCRQ